MKVKNSLFEITRSPVVLTLYQLEIISDETKKNPEASAADILNLAGVSEEYHVAVAELLQSWNTDKDATPKPRTKKGKRNPGDTLSDFLSSLNNTQICLCLANFDPIKAHNIYTSVDFRVATEAFSTWSEREMTLLRSQLEAITIGMGGELKEPKKENNVHDGTSIPKGQVISFG